MLYSVFARYRVRSGNISPKATLRDLFGRAGASAIIDLPCNIDALINKMPDCWNYNAKDLIYNHTLYPFYAPFLPAERARWLLEAMRSSHGGSVHAMTGIMASSVMAPAYLRFCPECTAEDKSKYGEMYWHRLHQVPGVLICPNHEQFLLDSSVIIRGLNKHEFVPASEEYCHRQEIYKFGAEYSKDVLTKLADLAAGVQELLNFRIKGADPDRLRHLYLSELMKRELATYTGRVYQSELLDEFIKFFGDEFLMAVQSPIDRKKQDNWLANIVRKHRKSFHPIRHLLMIMFLGSSVQSLIKAEGQNMPFGKGPWPCLNASAEHYLENVVKDINISHCGDTKKPVGTFTCSCGFVYSRRGPDKKREDRYGIGRIKVLGPVWENRLRHFVEQEKLGLRETARRLKVDPMTVKKYAQLLGLSTYWSTQKEIIDKDVSLNNKKVQDKLEDLREDYRAAWISLREHFSMGSKTELRKIEPGTYIWLYRHDRDWLTQNSPPAKCNYNSNIRVNWHDRDQLVLDNVKKAVKKLLFNDEKPFKVSISRIGKMTGTQALLEKHLDKMPLTREFLEKSIDSLESFQVRRVKWAVRKLSSEGECPKKWRVAKASGLRRKYMKRLDPVIDSEIESYMEQGWVEQGCLNSEIGHLNRENYLQ